MIYSTVNNNKKAIDRGYKFIIYKNSMFHFFSSNSERAYKRIIKKLKFEIQEIQKQDEKFTAIIYRGDIQEKSFTSKEQLPKRAKKIKALSNGSIVSCYYLREGDTLYFYRSNPNSKDIYKPLNLKRHIKHIEKYGTL